MTFSIFALLLSLSLSLPPLKPHNSSVDSRSNTSWHKQEELTHTAVSWHSCLHISITAICLKFIFSTFNAISSLTLTISHTVISFSFLFKCIFAEGLLIWHTKHIIGIQFNPKRWLTTYVRETGPLVCKCSVTAAINKTWSHVRVSKSSWNMKTTCTQYKSYQFLGLSATDLDEINTSCNQAKKEQKVSSLHTLTKSKILRNVCISIQWNGIQLQYYTSAKNIVQYIACELQPSVLCLRPSTTSM